MPILRHMANPESSLDDVFHALSDPTRRAMLASLADGERNIGELAEPFEISFAAASKHVKVLEGAGLIRRRIEGRSHVCRMEAGPLAEADQWLRFYERFWSARLDTLEQLLQQDDATSDGMPLPNRKETPR